MSSSTWHHEFHITFTSTLDPLLPGEDKGLGEAWITWGAFEGQTDILVFRWGWYWPLIYIKSGYEPVSVVHLWQNGGCSVSRFPRRWISGVTQPALKNRWLAQINFISLDLSVPCWSACCLRSFSTLQRKTFWERLFEYWNDFDMKVAKFSDTE